jgi:glc operon protein GlcG
MIPVSETANAATLQKPPTRRQLVLRASLATLGASGLTAADRIPAFAEEGGKFTDRQRRFTQQHTGVGGMTLSLEEADRIIRGAIAKAETLSIKISVAVCDAGGRLVALQRMDGAFWASAYGCQGKAVASAAFGRPSGELAARVDQPTPRGIVTAAGGDMIMGQGGIPIIRNGVVEGGCGVGGGTSQQDEDCARVGVKQL